eukprot:7465173-Pyramimonas_sp.AAC.1
MDPASALAGRSRTALRRIEQCPGVRRWRINDCTACPMLIVSACFSVCGRSDRAVARQASMRCWIVELASLGSSTSSTHGL